MAQDIGNTICENLGFARASVIEGELLWNYHRSDAVQVRDLMKFDESPAPLDSVSAQFNLYNDCEYDAKDIMVECESSLDGPNCLQIGKQCAIDLDCCDQMFCSPVSGNCVDPVTYLIHSQTLMCKSCFMLVEVSQLVTY